MRPFTDRLGTPCSERLCTAFSPLVLLLTASCIGAVGIGGCLSNECLEVGPAGDPELGRYYPLQEGAWWVHRVEKHDTGRVEYKRVAVLGPSEQIPTRPDVRAFPVQREFDIDARRWQELQECDTVRHVDEWFDGPIEDGILDHVTFYCPSKLRVPDCEHAAACESWKETFWTLEISDWTGCDDLTLDDECRPIDRPSGCAVGEPSSTTLEYFISGDVEEKSDVHGNAFETMAVQTNEDGLLGYETTYWWARGVGKIQAYSERVESQMLCDFCVPDYDDGCDRLPPAQEDLPALCGD